MRTHVSWAVSLLAASIGLFAPVDIDIQTLQPRPASLVMPCWAAAAVTDSDLAKLAEVRQMLQSGKYSAAEAILTRSLELWTSTKQPAIEIATIFKDRGIARQVSNPTGALADLDAALQLYEGMSVEERPLEEVVGATFLRAQVDPEPPTHLS